MKDPQTKNKIIEGTINCIDKLGIENVTIRKIARETGISFSSIHYYFDSKEELIEIALKSAISGALDDLSTIWEENKQDSFKAVYNIFLFLLDGAIKFPGITKAGLHPLIMQNNNDSYFINGLNDFFEKLASSLSEELKINVKAIKMDLINITSSILFIGMAPKSFCKFSGFCFNDHDTIKEFIITLLKNSSMFSK